MEKEKKNFEQSSKKIYWKENAAVLKSNILIN